MENFNLIHSLQMPGDGLLSCQLEKSTENDIER